MVCTRLHQRVRFSLKSYVSFAKEPYKRDDILQKRLISAISLSSAISLFPTGCTRLHQGHSCAPMALVCTSALQHATHAAHECPCKLVCTSALPCVTRVHLSTALCRSCVPQRCIMSHMVHMSALAHSCALQRCIMSRRLEQKTVPVELYTRTHTHKRARTHTHKLMH